uniref:Leucine-rich repeat-containing N-terminal plant-type domain-containing protein n=2 Tax=Ditylum brightwellii TaxID=49249 RepID=A0A7S4SMT0_9STRA
MDIKIDLSFNMLTGAVPLTFDAFTKLDINLVGDIIDELDDTFCDNDEWMAGADQRYGCIANLCPKNKYHPRGRQIDNSRDCKDYDPGEDAPFMGSLTCRSQGLLFEEGIIPTHIYDAINGTNWVKQRKWNSNAPICTWYGVGCDGDDENSGVTSLQLGNNNLEAIAPAKEAPATMFCILPTCAR